MLSYPMFDPLKITDKIVGQLWLFVTACTQLILSFSTSFSSLFRSLERCCFSKVLGIRKPKEELVKDIDIACSGNHLKN